MLKAGELSQQVSRFGKELYSEPINRHFPPMILLDLLLRMSRGFLKLYQDSTR
jgi:hypothetical protein